MGGSDVDEPLVVVEVVSYWWPGVGEPLVVVVLVVSHWGRWWCAIGGGSGDPLVEVVVSHRGPGWW